MVYGHSTKLTMLPQESTSVTSVSSCQQPSPVHAAAISSTQSSHHAGLTLPVAAAEAAETSAAAPANCSQAKRREKSKRKQVKNACVNCQKACKKCDDGRACQRCIKLGLTATCVDSPRKERRKGVKRGPYKKRQPHEQTQLRCDKTELENAMSLSCPSTATTTTTSGIVTHGTLESWYYTTAESYGNSQWTTTADPAYMVPQQPSLPWESVRSSEMFGFDPFFLPLMTTSSSSTNSSSNPSSPPTTPPSNATSACLDHHCLIPLTTQQGPAMFQSNLLYHPPLCATPPQFISSKSTTAPFPSGTSVHVKQHPMHHWSNPTMTVDSSWQFTL
ncbi:hypothetical protein BX666DRAFT_108842 [Dichotomocladium elegans]|nr:hypothetical protein BX666DRAFT_108842 [Dichotomocladium elegans]